MPQVRSLQPGDPHQLGSFAVTGRLGEGGQGTVYLGRGPDGRTVAIKVLHTRLAGDDTARSRFLREAAAARQVARFCTAQVIAADVAGDRPYIVSEYVPGRSLHTLVKQEGARSGGDMERLAIGTATALAAIHKAGIVHRDLQPGNVLVGPDGPRVIDFGVARIIDGTVTDNNAAIGTPAFMAPEQFSNGRVGPAADVFAWGATMAFAASGRSPFDAEALPAVVNRILHDQPDLGALEPPLRELVAAALAKDPLHRPGARDLLDRLLDADSPAATTAMAPAATPTTGGGLPFRTPQPGGHTDPGTQPRPADPRQRRGLLIAGSTVLGGALATALVLAFVLAGPDRDAKSSASSTQGAVPAASSAPGTAPSGTAASPGPAKATLPGQGSPSTTAQPTRTPRPGAPPPGGPTGPTVLGKPDTEHYCPATATGPTKGPTPGGYSRAYYEDGSWRCPSTGIVPYVEITMTDVCKKQYGSSAYARYNGGGPENGANYDCVKD
ncbi:MAG: protein kinase domain-containing protein [Actinomadura sp.]